MPIVRNDADGEFVLRCVNGHVPEADSEHNTTMRAVPGGFFGLRAFRCCVCKYVELYGPSGEKEGG